MKSLILALSLLILGTSYVVANDVEDFAFETKMSKVVMQTADSTVSIIGIGDGGMDRCSGTLYKNDPDNTIVLTAKHCISPVEEMYVENVLVKDTEVSRDDDIAYLVLVSPIPDKKPIKLATKDASIKDIVFIIGYPNGDPYIRLGNVNLQTSDWQYMRMMVIPGCSGGGVFNENGELVGVLWGGFKSEATAIFEPLSDVKRFLKDKKLL